MTIVNLTSHEITDANTGIVYKPSGQVIRANSKGQVQEGYGITVLTYEYYLTEGTMLPPEIPGYVYIVSNLALNAIPKHRTDFVAPGPVEKDERGKPVCCRGFRR